MMSLQIAEELNKLDFLYINSGCVLFIMKNKTHPE
jgi:hypothetical protein